MKGIMPGTRPERGMRVAAGLGSATLALLSPTGWMSVTLGVFAAAALLSGFRRRTTPIV